MSSSAVNQTLTISYKPLFNEHGDAGLAVTASGVAGYGLLFASGGNR